MEELCCLFALGELSQQEWNEFSDHLKKCPECREQTREFEKLILFDLSSATVLRMEHLIPESMGFNGENELRARIRERVRTVDLCHQDAETAKPKMVEACAVPVWKRSAHWTGRAIPWAGWAAAATLLLWQGTNRTLPRHEQPLVAAHTATVSTSAETVELERKIAALSANRNELAKRLSEAEAFARDSKIALTLTSMQSRNLGTKEAVLSTELDRLHADLRQRSAELELARRQLSNEIGAREAVRGQLAEVNARLEKQKSEVFRLQEAANGAKVRLPMASSELTTSEAREILGARDLHIVDVYDVDNGGRSSRVYGRVYYMNHNVLVFYAFDLSRVQKNHKAAAFQAWGFRQPHTTTAESLGLFSMDNASLNRWALRVSDPQVLSRIDTLFVTLEPPGGSSTPKGERLLMASLAGPPNHP